MVVVFIILDWIFVSMNATAMWFPASMSHVKVFDLSIFFFSGKNVSIVANCFLIKCSIFLILF